MAEVVTPLPGSVTSINVKPGDRVEAGDVLVTLEVMKMMQEIQAEEGGTVAAIHVKEGDMVNPGDVILTIL